MEEMKIYNALSRIDDGLIDSSLNRKTDKRHKIIALTVCSCITIALCLVLGISIFNHRNADRFSSKGALGNGSFVDGNAERLSYLGIRFYESLGKTYMIYSEYQSRYEFDGERFVDTGVKVAETQFFTAGEKDGYSYVGGVFHCVGGNESGLFRIKLSSGEVEKIIDSNETVDWAAINGDKLYYVSYTWKNAHTIYEDRSDVRYSLKCADLDTKQIKLIYQRKGFIQRLKIFDGKVYFSTENSVCGIDEDNNIHEVKTDGVSHFRDYSVIDNGIVIYKFDVVKDGQGGSTRTNTVYLYSDDGRLLSSVSEHDKYFLGSSFDELTVYQEKVAAFDKDGMYLLDIKTGEYEQIYSMNLKEASDYLSERFFEGISKTVHNGKLYYNFGAQIIEYSPDGVRTFDVEEESE
jgi:hypothetical protein